VALNLVQLVTDQISVQRYMTATSLREGQRALWFKLILTLPVISVFYLTGLVLFSFYQTHPEVAATLTSADRLLPNFVANQVPTPIPGLLVAAILSATMSVVSSGINSLTTATMMDFASTRKQDGPAVAEAGKVRVARGWTILYGVLVTLLGLVVSRLGSLIEAAAKIGGFFGGPLLGIFFLGVLSRRANPNGTLIGTAVGFAAVVGVGFCTQTSFMWYALIGCVVTYGVGEMASRFFPAPDEKQISFSLAGQKGGRISENP
jgi:Na+/proline symporter